MFSNSSAFVWSNQKRYVLSAQLLEATLLDDMDAGTTLSLKKSPAGSAKELRMHSQNIPDPVEWSCIRLMYKLP